MERRRALSNKGQFQHVFTFILMILIAGVVLVLGYKFIHDIFVKSCEIETLELKNDLEQDLKRYADYGSYHERAYAAPCDSVQLCFVDADLFGEQNGGIYNGTSGFLYPDIPAIQGEVRSPSPNNIFLIFEDRTEPLQAFSKRIDVPSGVLCVDVIGGRYRLGFDGKGLTVGLSDVS